MNFRILKRRVHVSWLIAALAAGIVVGIILAQYASFFVHLPWLIFGLLAAGFAFWRGRAYSVPLLIIAGCVVGLWRGGIMQGDLAPYKNLVGYEVTIQGKVAEDPELDEKNATVLRVDVQMVNGHALGGKGWVNTHSKNDIKRGDEVTLKGELAEGFGSFAGSMYRAEILKVERPMPGDIAGRARDWFADNP